MTFTSGTTAFYAARAFARSNFRDTVEVIAIPCVGSHTYLVNQLKHFPGSHETIPTILSDGNTSRFGALNVEHFRIWDSLQTESGIDFDLLYAPRAFEVLIHHLLLNSNNILDLVFTNQLGILYYHCGGLEGNTSQLGRYKRTYPELFSP